MKQCFRCKLTKVNRLIKVRHGYYYCTSCIEEMAARDRVKPCYWGTSYHVANIARQNEAELRRHHTWG